MKVAKYSNTICHVCNNAINMNEEIFPFVKKYDKKRLATFNTKQNLLIFSKQTHSWCHVECVCNILNCNDKTKLLKPICPFYAKNKYCGYYDSCFYRHDESIFDKKNNILVTEHSNKNNIHKKRKKRNQNFATKFKNWLVENYGMSNLAQSNVLDIAGGKGDLSFELLHLVGVKSSTVIDPRIVNVNDVYQKLCAGKYVTNALYHKYINKSILQKLIILKQEKNLKTSCESSKDFMDHMDKIDINKIQHLKMFFNQKTIDWYDNMLLLSSPTDDNVNNDLNKFKVMFDSFLKEIENKILVGETGKIYDYKKGVSKDQMVLNNNCKGLKSSACHFLPNKQLIMGIVNYVDAFHVMKKCDLIVGLHCDGAAESIIDFALKYSIKFAIIPCCTCSKDFPNRKINGNLVKSYNDLLLYLKSKDNRIMVDEIASFSKGSKNKVLYIL